MTLTIDEAFRKFKNRLELNQREQDNAIARHKEVRELRFPHIFFTRPGPGSVVAARFHSARSIPVTRRPIRAMAEARGAAILA